MKKLVMVECISQFRVRFVVEVENDSTHALDEVVMNSDNPDFHEFSQKHLGSVIVSNRDITKQEYLEIFDDDNDYLRSWSDEQKYSVINKIDYSE